MSPSEVKVATIARYVRTTIIRIDKELSRPNLPQGERDLLERERKALWPLVELLLDRRPQVEATKRGEAA